MGQVCVECISREKNKCAEVHHEEESWRGDFRLGRRWRRYV